ncbi:MAG: F0F1 ATP synthase subunit alpha [Oscillospiraceae bacterium]|jgi:F-type H+-transporting ATPase subunit alpha|nr:F0F1 ATP synthase subunit alpha [Oscillospiraceae bacterium]
MQLKSSETARVLELQMRKHLVGFEMAQVVSACKLDNKRLQEIKDCLQQKFGVTIEIENVVDESLVGGIVLKYGGKVFDMSTKKYLKDISLQLQKRGILADGSTKGVASEMRLKPDEIVKVIKDEIERYSSKVELLEVGTVISVGSGIIHIYGLPDCMSGELLELECGSQALVLSLEEDVIGAVVLGSSDHIKEGFSVKRTGKVVSVPVGEEMIGRVVNALGEPIDGAGPINTCEFRNVENEAPGIADREAVHIPLETGIKAVDSMIPIGRGQRELIIGDRQTGKTSIALDTIMNQRGKGMICIYVAIGQKNSTVAQVVELLKANGAMAYTIVVSATASESAAMQYLAPYSGCAIGEFFMGLGKDVLCVYDDLSKHAVAYRAISLLLRKPPGREAYPGDVFYLHARLLERAANMNKSCGGGSMSALPIIETQAGDVSAYIPTNVISITDGQIFLEGELFNAGIRPAVNPGVSVSRVGGNAQIAALRKLSGALKLLYSQFLELQSFAQFGSDLDDSTKKKIEQGQRILEILKQNNNSPVRIECQVIIVYAMVNHLLSDIAVAAILRFEAGLIEYVSQQWKNLLDAILRDGLTEAVEKDINTAILEYKKVFVA